MGKTLIIDRRLFNNESYINSIIAQLKSAKEKMDDSTDYGVRMFVEGDLNEAITLKRLLE